MKKLFFLIALLFLFTNCSEAQSSHEKEIKAFQYKLNTQYADSKKSPLTKEDLPTFKALDFFDINEDYRIVATFKRTPNAPVFEMATTTSRLPLYKKFGIATFELDGIKCELSIYQNQSLLNSLEYSNHLFLPYNDTTNGKTSYGGGRFIDLEIPKDGSDTILIDFNKSYNPYCAYNHKYSCPIPPSENNLSVAIPAGVKAYGKHH